MSGSVLFLLDFMQMVPLHSFVWIMGGGGGTVSVNKSGCRGNAMYKVE